MEMEMAASGEGSVKPAGSLPWSRVVFIFLSLQFSDARLFHLELHRGKEQEHMAALRNTEGSERGTRPS